MEKNFRKMVSNLITTEKKYLNSNLKENQKLGNKSRRYMIKRNL